MKKKTWLIAAVCILLILSALIILDNRPTPQDEMMNMLNRVDNALGDEWTKQSVTKVSDLVYSDNDGNTIIYHVCTTRYYEANSVKQSGINTDAISAVISPDKAESYRECTVSGSRRRSIKKTDEPIFAGRSFLSLAA